MHGGGTFLTRTLPFPIRYAEASRQLPARLLPAHFSSRHRAQVEDGGLPMALILYSRLAVLQAFGLVLATIRRRRRLCGFVGAIEVIA